MNEREEFLQHIQSVLATMVQRLQTMTESEVLDGLREVKTARAVYREELVERFKTMTEAQAPSSPRQVEAARNAYNPNSDLRAFAKKLRLQSSFFNSIVELRSRLSLTARGGSPPALFDTLEDALNQRLESLRRTDTSA